MPRVSVIVPVHNAECDLAQCLDTICAQTFGDIEVICVNDGSTDRSGEILDAYAAGDSRITVIEQPNEGASVARNRGLDAAVGEYIQFLDADDFFEPDLIEKTYGRCVEDDADVGVFPIRCFYEDQGSYVDTQWSLVKSLLPEHIPFSAGDMKGGIFRFVTPGVWNKTFRRSFIVENGLRFSPDLRRAEDLPFAFLALAKAQRITVIDEYLVNYRKHSRGSLQQTIHEMPLEICRSLVHFRSQLVDAGLFSEMERDFVNAALHQCLYTVDSIRTVEAYSEIYGALKDSYFRELGILDRPGSYFYSKREYDTLAKVLVLSPAEFLFEEMLDRQASLRHMQKRNDSADQQVTRAREKLAALRRSASFRLGRRAARLGKAVRRIVKRDGRSTR